MVTDPIYRLAAEKIAAEPVSIEPDGSVWADSDHRNIDVSAVQSEYQRLLAHKTAARESAIAKLAALGLDADEVSALIGGAV